MCNHTHIYSHSHSTLLVYTTTQSYPLIQYTHTHTHTHPCCVGGAPALSRGTRDGETCSSLCWGVCCGGNMRKVAEGALLRVLRCSWMEPRLYLHTHTHTDTHDEHNCFHLHPHTY
jgi:hypothetical protein